MDRISWRITVKTRSPNGSFCTSDGHLADCWSSTTTDGPTEYPDSRRRRQQTSSAHQCFSSSWLRLRSSFKRRQTTYELWHEILRACDSDTFLLSVEARLLALHVVDVPFYSLLPQPMSFTHVYLIMQSAHNEDTLSWLSGIISARFIFCNVLVESTCYFGPQRTR